MDFSDIKRIKSINYRTLSVHQDQIFMELSKRKSEGIYNQNLIKTALIIYVSGSVGANKELQIEKGGLHKLMLSNFYLCDLQASKKFDPKLQQLTTPVQQSGSRIRYKITQMPKIDVSINMKTQLIQDIAKIIEANYNQFNSFIVITGLDTICHVGTVLSFMLENLSKLVICTGGYLPLGKMRNDSVSNLVQCFSLVSQASTLNDVIIVCKNKGFRANRCIKTTQGDFQTISSPNIPALCSIKTNLRVRSYLFQPVPINEFKIFTGMSNRVKVMKLNQYQCIQSLAYDLKNPYVKGIVIQSYSFANLPNIPQMLNLFKQAYQDESRKTIFINISQAICAKNESMMKQYLEDYHIYFGGDMTCQAALAKLSYLIGKNYPQTEIIRLIEKNMRGQLTEKAQKNQFKVKKTNLMQIVNGAINQYFPSILKDLFESKIQNNISKYIINKCTVQQFKQIFENPALSSKQNNQKIRQIAEQHFLLHKASLLGNLQMAQFLIKLGVNVNAQDLYERSPLFYAIKKTNKSMIQLLSKNGARVIASTDQLFQIFIEAIKNDNIEFFNLLYHTQFRQTMKTLKNQQLRSVAHIAGLLKVSKCFKYLKQKFSLNLNQEDVYGFTPNQYMSQLNQ